MEYVVKLENFEGPLDLLIYLIEKAKVDIVDISITSIADQYIDYISTMESIDMDLASEFLLMASTLLKLKSESLLPNDNNNIQLSIDEVDSKETLRQKLIEYKKYKSYAQALVNKYKSRKIFYRNKTIFSDDFAVSKVRLKKIPVEKLKNVYAKVIKKNNISARQKQFTLDHIKNIKPLNVEEKIEYLKRIISIKKTITFFYLVSLSNEKSEIIAYFLAILEMLRLNQLCAIQEKIFGDIILRGVINDG